ncbi:hypothetical protein JCM19275_938 [Nonlabens ulvanivorans]|uniref:Uncharacterized protein n=1 Tax=Nonlabens ulvanivorans TaxID=906888 RepID=A0A090WHL9_NONUL|nr:hypothetical protein [Nonlabens ulvanivorans]GAL74899.1 hypothetical protein JCM19275_938 [Nonlabens ulvanivorans]
MRSIKVPRHQNQLIYYDELLQKLIFFNKNQVTVLDNNLNLESEFYNTETPKQIQRITDTTYIAAYYNRVAVLNNQFKEQAIIPERTSHVLKSMNHLIYYSSVNGLYTSNSSLNGNTPVLNHGKKVTASKLINQLNSNFVWAIENNSILKIEEGQVIASDINDILNTDQIYDLTSDYEHLFFSTGNGLHSYCISSKEVHNYSNLFLIRIKRLQLSL